MTLIRTSLKLQLVSEARKRKSSCSSAYVLQRPVPSRAESISCQGPQPLCVKAAVLSRNQLPVIAANWQCKQQTCACYRFLQYRRRGVNILQTHAKDRPLSATTRWEFAIRVKIAGTECKYWLMVSCWGIRCQKPCARPESHLSFDNVFEPCTGWLSAFA